MTSLAELTEPPALDINTMTKVQKLAALLIILGPESAAQILRSLSPQDLNVVSAEMAQMPMITQELRADILREMSTVAMAASTAMRGGVEFAQHALEKAVGAGKASDIINRVSPARGPSSAAQRLSDMEPRHVFNLIKDEHVQTIALVTSYLKPEKASEFLGLLPPEARDQVIERLATLEATPVEVMEKVVEVMERRLNSRSSRGMNQTGGVKSAADVLNALSKNLSKTIITSLEERNAELGQAIRQKMFTFDDMVKLDAAALQKVMREVDMRDLALSLKKADAVIKAKLFSAISKRAAETVNEEISFMGSVKLKEIELAQTKIIEVVRRLENEGEIDLDMSRETAAA
ncbi:MAG TPA: flagellar motor switch protein FliG [Verrucomicrobiae bacterium]|jgi:flagellar motor switch protein FliG